MEATHTARVYLQRQQASKVWVQLPNTSYQLELGTAGPVVASPQGRVRGVIRCPVWKLDLISVGGGAFVEPLVGRPRRVQGHVIATVAETNSVVVEVAGQPIVGDLPERWQAAELTPGTRVGLDVKEGSTFEAI